MMSLASRITDLAAAVRDKLNTMTPRLLPSGGTAGQVLAKVDAANYNANWVAPSGGGGVILNIDGGDASSISPVETAIDGGTA